MPESADGLALDHRPALAAALGRCVAGEIPPNVALMRMLVEAHNPAEVETVLREAIERLRSEGDARGVRHLSGALTLLHDNPDAFTTVRRVIDGVEHDGTDVAPDAAVARWAEVFDRAARASAEGGVALYALGNPELLRDTTAEVVACMGAWGLLGPSRTALEIGCGIGRFQEALAGELRFCVGIDISAEMLLRARLRCAQVADVAFVRSSGEDLAAFRDESFDLVLAADSFPYLVQPGLALASRHVEDAARVLRPGGSLLVLNFSYRGDLDADRRDLREAGARAGLDMVRTCERPFVLWDGAAFELRKTR